MATADQAVNISRPLAGFSPSKWGYTFASLASSPEVLESRRKEVEELKEKVETKMLLLSSAAAAADTKKARFEKVEFINLLERLGVSYHFQTQIDEQLRLIYEEEPDQIPRCRDDDDDCDDDLYSVSLLFRVLRQHGYRVPCDVFEQFKDRETKEFKECLRRDVLGILSLYEASHLRLRGEDILDEALAFSTSILTEIIKHSGVSTSCSTVVESTTLNPKLIEHIQKALICPYHKSARRVDACRYISFYGEERSRDETLLRFAKVDFNYVQLLHRDELGLVSRWWRDTGLAEELRYARNRIVELYFWAMGSHYEPGLSASRIAATKYAKMVSLVDDTYDAYATPKELQLFTAAFQRCDVSAVEQLPEYMKVLFRAFLKLYDETEQDVEKEERSYSAHQVKEAFKELVRAYDVEAKWLEDGYTPTMTEFIQNGIPSSSYGVISAAYFIGMGEAMGVKEYDWLKTNPTIDTTAKLLGRLLNDIMSHKDEQKRGHCPSAVECYKKENDASDDDEAVEAIRKMCEDAWKDLNEECMRPTATPAVGMPVVQHFLNLVRIITFIYIRDDSYTHSVSLEEHITNILLEPVPM